MERGVPVTGWVWKCFVEIVFENQLCFVLQLISLHLIFSSELHYKGSVPKAFTSETFSSVVNFRSEAGVSGQWI